MTSIQISALIFLIFSAALLYWIVYRHGLTDWQKNQPTTSTRRKAA